MAESTRFELEIGFDLDTASDEALRVARDRWLTAVVRAGKVPTGSRIDLAVRNSAGLDRIGQYSVVISGEVVDGDQ